MRKTHTEIRQEFRREQDRRTARERLAGSNPKQERPYVRTNLRNEPPIGRESFTQTICVARQRSGISGQPRRWLLNRYRVNFNSVRHGCFHSWTVKRAQNGYRFKAMALYDECLRTWMVMRIRYVQRNSN